MCKKSLLMMLLLALLVPWAANAQSVQIGDGTGTNNYLPSTSTWNYSVTQQIYTAEEIDASGNITSIAFYNAGTEKARKYNIYMAHTTKSAFESTTDWIALTDANLVYQGAEAVAMVANTWTTFTLDTPFAYNGTDNLVIGVLDLTGSWSSGMSCRAFTAADQALYKYQDAGAYGIDGTYNGTVQTGTIAATKNQIILGGIQQARPAPTGLTATPHPTTADLSWTENGTATQWEVAYKTSAEEEFTTVVVNTNPYTLTGLTGETAYNVKVRAYYSETAQSQWSAVVNFTTQPACPAPTALASSNLTTNSATLTWTAGYEESDWVLQYGTTYGFTEGTYTEVTVNGTPTYEVTGLSELTTYYARVKADCGGDSQSAWSTVATFTTKESCPDGMVCIGEGTTTSYYLPAHNYYNYSLTQQIYTAAEIGEAGAILSIDFFKAATTAMVKNLDIYMVSTTKDEFASATDFVPVTSSDLVFSGTVTFADNAWTTIELDAPFIYDGTSNVAIMVDNNTGDYESSTPFYVFTSDKNQALYAQADGTNYDPFAPSFSSRTAQKNRIRLAIGEPPACPKPTGLTVNYEGGVEATISWTSDAEAWNMRVNGVDVNDVITNPYTLTGLELATNYTVEVQANCGSATSDWASTSFTTDPCMPEDMCEITFELTDSFGDGWNGNAIKVVDALTGAEIGSVTIASGNSYTGTIAVCDGRAINFVWVAGSYASETSYVVYDINDEEIFSGSAGNGLIENYTVSCTVSPCRKPTDLAISEVGPRSAVLDWTENGEATAWQVEISEVGVEGTTVWNANEKPFTIVGLNPETNYSVRVLPDCELEKWSDPITFTTTVACPAPTDLTATDLMPTSATLAWEGFGEGYEVEYAIASVEGIISIDFEDGTLGDWTVIDADGDGYNWNAWSSTEMVVGHNNSTYVVTSASYQGAALTPDNYLVSPQVQLGGTITFWACAQDASWPTEHFGVAVSTAGNTDAADFTTIWESDMTAKRVGTAQFKTKKVDGLFKDADRSGSRELGAWYEYTIDLSAYNGQTGYVAIRHFDCTDMFRLNVDDITIMEPGASEPTWIPVGEVTSPYTLNGLEPETRYNVRVRATCGEDGESEWAHASFTTLSLCDLPSNLAVADNTTGNSVTLDWTGYQESYNVKYRHATEVDPTAPAIIILEAHDTWGDGTGYQMLLDADATAYGVEIPESGPYTGSDYSAFEYLIPENADCDSNTENLVLDGSITLEIPAGVYDWCIINPEPGGNMWISGNGDIPGRYDDYVFEAGVTYHFTMQLFGTGDGAALEIIRSMSDWTEVTVNEVPYTLTGLTPETYYEWQIQGINEECGELEWVAGPSFTTPEQTTLTQTIELAAGSNYVSFYVDITLDDLKAALLATGNTDITIKSKTQNTYYQGGRWRGSLTWDVSKMYIIQVGAASEITFEGMPMDPAEYPITVVNGSTYIGFPLSESMSLTDAFAGFAVNDDVIQSKTGSAQYKRGRWQGSSLTTLEPGKGYIYKSSQLDDRTLVYPTNAK